MLSVSQAFYLSVFYLPLFSSAQNRDQYKFKQSTSSSVQVDTKIKLNIVTLPLSTGWLVLSKKLSW